MEQDSGGERKLMKPAYVPIRVIRWDDGSEMRFGHASWLMLLGLAFKYGWRPAGTEEPDHWAFNPWSRSRAGWSGADYFSNLGQRISASDAGALGVALEEAVPEIPRESQGGSEATWRLDLPWGEPMTWRDGQDGGAAESIPGGIGGGGSSESTLAFFSGAARDRVALFASRCRENAFRIC